MAPGAPAMKFRAPSCWMLVRVLATASIALVGGATANAQPPTGAPVMSSPPVLKGSSVDGKKLKVAAGSWSGAKPLTYAYKWERCNASGQACASLSSATGSAYQATSQDVGSTLRAVVTATNPEGSASAASPLSAKIAPAAPKKRKAPAIAGAAQDGQVLTISNGTWKGTEPMSFTYQWQSCMGSACTPIAGATGSSYRTGSAQLGSKLVAVVTATNAGGSSSAHSKKSSVVAPGPPVDLGAPTVAGLAVVGQTLTAEVGEWAGTAPFAYSYQWLGCNLLGECTPISGATGATYAVGPLQVANSIEVSVTAKNSLGSASATSKPTNAISALLPANLELPSITGLLHDGGLLSALTGSWSGTEPLGFSYQWELCNAAGAACKEISGALGSTLSLIAGEVGSTLRVIVTATNNAGSASATSEPTSLIKGLLPSNLELPSVSGLLQDGGLLTALIGSWSGTEPLSYSYQWELCNASGANCEAVSGALNSTLALLAADVGSTVRVAVTATNGAGSTTATSSATTLVKALLPSNTVLPSVGGLLQDGSSLTAALGSWSGTGPLTYGYQWLVCNSSGGSCKELLGATEGTLGLLTGMIGSTVRLVVTATNGAGSTSATSEPTSVVKALLPSNTGLPSIVGSLIDGSSLTGAKGSWSGSEPSFGYQWLLCNSSGASCKELSGATGGTLGLLTGMIGSTVRLVVTATNGAGSTSATSEPTSVITALLPSNTGLPSIAGSLIDGSSLTGAKGSWSGSEPTFSYQWLLCNSAGGSCKELSGATGGTLGLLTSEIGSTVRLVVKATNSAGSASATSEPTGLIKALIPSNTGLPTVAGVLEDGHTLTGAKGSWSGSEPSFGYQWLLCNSSGGSCKELSGATGTTLGLIASEIGSTVRLVVTAKNSAGSTSATSEPTSPILAILPVNTAAPAVAGLLQVGKILEVVAGKWTGSEPIKYTYQWQTCGLLGSEKECANIPEAIQKTLKLELAWVGLTLRVIETATNARGAVSKASSITGLIGGLLLAPNSGSTSGGTAVTLAAPGVARATAVHFGSKKSSEIEVNSPNEITAVSPPGSEGTVPVTVTTPEGSSHENPEDQFTYSG